MNDPKKSPPYIAQTLGCESVAQVSRVSGVNYRTLMQWAKNKPQVFKTLCMGVAEQVKGGEIA